MLTTDTVAVTYGGETLTEREVVLEPGATLELEQTVTVADTGSHTTVAGDASITVTAATPTPSPTDTSGKTTTADDPMIPSSSPGFTPAVAVLACVLALAALRIRH